MSGFFSMKKDTKPLLKEEKDKLQEEVRALKEQVELFKIKVSQQATVYIFFISD